MTVNTIDENRKMDHFDGHHEVWLFGYGSLIYKADFPWIDRKPAFIKGWTRRFWQGSHDHRGTPDAPGRVVTLIPDSGAVCPGMAYLISPQVFNHLDHREKNGYLRIVEDIWLSGDKFYEGVIYVASEDNEAFLGPASECEIARHIAVSEGPSGRNTDYVISLADALRELEGDDPHVFAIEQYLMELETQD